MNKRTAREILVKDEFLYNKENTVRIGTVENRDFPETVYINIGFWIQSKICALKKSQENLNKKKLEDSINKIFEKKIVNFLKKSSYFSNIENNIYICNIPESFSCNNKSSFISLEIYLHTININSKKKYALNAKKNTELFDECVKICNFVGKDIKKVEKNFYVRKNSKSKANITSESEKEMVSDDSKFRKNRGIQAN
jgi:hypothetical protein